MSIRMTLGAAVLAISASVNGQTTERVTYDGHAVVQTTIRSLDDLLVMRDISDDPWSHRLGLGPVIWRVDQEGMAELRTSGIPFEIMIEDLGPLIAAEHDRVTNAPAEGPGSWYDDYKDLTAVNARMDMLANDYPALASIVNIGTSLEGRAIRGLRITGPGTGKPGVLYNSCQHAREWVSVMTTMYIAEQLLAQYDSDPAIQELVDAIEFVIVPIVNPDGYVWTWGPDRLWRKNRRNNGDGTMGVDLNRNWAFQWGGPGSDGNTNSNTYRGPSPFSEPETTALSAYFGLNPQIVATIDFHCFSQLALAPWGYTDTLPPDHDLYQVMGAAMVDAITEVHGESYIHGPANPTLYPASGVSIDWTYGAAGVLSFTVELRDQGQFGFILPPEQIIPTAEENIAGALAFAEFVLQGVAFGTSAFPDYVPANTETTVGIEISPVASGPLDTDSGKLIWRVGEAGGFNETPLTHTGGDAYDATLPAADCGSVIEYRLAIDSMTGTTYEWPDADPLVTESSVAALVVLENDFEATGGWTVENVAVTDGAWSRGVPAGAGDRGDPTQDADGSGACWLTDNVPGNSDVDGGPTRLVSPTMDFSALGDPVVSVATWFTNDDGDGDRLDIEISDDDGATWNPVLSLAQQNGWTTYSFSVAAHASVTDTMRLRFNATDNPNDSITEAGIDALMVVDLACGAAVPGDVNGDGTVDVADLLELLASWGPCGGCPADLDGNGVVDVSDMLMVLAGWSS